ncbi:MAG: vWA domain-containing protein, partial [Methyloceanibacter sp.]
QRRRHALQAAQGDRVRALRMTMLSGYVCPVVVVLITLLAGPAAAQAPDDTRIPCTEDAMIVFDASGSMAGNTVQGLFNTITRIDEVRKALAQVLPNAAKFRKIGLITYGPGPYQQCNVTLDYPPMRNAAEPIMSVVNAINPAGKTPLVEGVKQAAEVLKYRTEKGVVVLLTDGEETCGGAPCELGKLLRADGRDLTVHVIGYQLLNFSWTGYQSILDVKCLAEETGGLYITAQNRQDLIEAFEKTLGCPMMSEVGASLR